MIKPSNSGGEVDGAEEVAGGLIVPADNAAILLKLVEELLDQVTGSVQVLVILGGCLRQRLGGMTTALPTFLARAR